jgi:hypothetical protein
VRKEYIWAAVSAAVVGIIGVLLLYLGGVAGVLPRGFGLFDMSNMGVRAVVFVILLVIAVLLFLWYRSTAASGPSDEARG